MLGVVLVFVSVQHGLLACSIVLLSQASLQGLWQFLGQRKTQRGDACSIAHSYSFTLLSVQGVFM